MNKEMDRSKAKERVLGGSLLAFLGFLLVIFAPSQLLLYIGFFAIGIGSANVVPVFFSLLGKQKDMPIRKIFCSRMKKTKVRHQ